MEHLIPQTRKDSEALENEKLEWTKEKLEFKHVKQSVVEMAAMMGTT